MKANGQTENDDATLQAAENERQRLEVVEVDANILDARENEL